jgi:hypothetical protein
VLVAAVLIWPTWSVAWSAADWRAPTMAERDMRQYVSDFSAGTSSEAALAWVRSRAAEGPVTVITGYWIGLPNDLLWLEASHDPRITMYWYDSLKAPGLAEAPGEPGRMMLGKDFWKNWRTEAVMWPAGQRIFLMVPGRWDAESQAMQWTVPMKELPAGTRVVAVFMNPVAWPAGMHTSELAVLELPGKVGGGDVEGDLATGAR